MLFSAISLWVITPLVNTLSELRRHVERLNSRVHVARSALVAQADEFLRSLIFEVVDFLLNFLNIFFLSWPSAGGAARCSSRQSRIVLNGECHGPVVVIGHVDVCLDMSE